MRKVLAHELAHAFMLETDLEMSIEQEEILADWISMYADDLTYLCDDLIGVMN